MLCHVISIQAASHDVTCRRYDNCYPRLDGATNIPGGGVYIDFASSLEHYPSLWQVKLAWIIRILAKLSCCPQSPPEQERYQPMAAALAAVKEERNITLELCAWGFGNVETFGPRLGHLWRTSMDIRCVTAETRDT